MRCRRRRRRSHCGYNRKLKEYIEARAAFRKRRALWSSISENGAAAMPNRRERQQITLDDYVLTQPPVYDGRNSRSIPSPGRKGPRASASGFRRRPIS